MADGLNHYTAYDLVIRSEYTLPELPSVGPDRPVDISINAGDLGSAPTSETTEDVQTIQPEPGKCRITHGSLGTFLVEDGSRVTCDPPSTDIVETKAFRRFLERQIIALLLLQRELLVVHGSAVAIDGDGVLFLGPRGAGKSTTASAFHQDGYTLLEDDIVGIRFDGNTPIVLPGIPQLRLTAESVDGLNVREAARPAVDWGPKKYYQNVDSRPSPVPLRRCYLLETNETLAIRDLPGREQFFRFIEHAYPQGLLSDVGMMPDDFERCSRVAEAVPIRALRRPKELGVMPSLIRLVIEDLDGD